MKVVIGPHASGLTYRATNKIIEILKEKPDAIVGVVTANALLFERGIGAKLSNDQVVHFTKTSQVVDAIVVDAIDYSPFIHEILRLDVPKYFFINQKHQDWVDAIFNKEDITKIDLFNMPNFSKFGITLDDLVNDTWQAKVTEEYPEPYLLKPQWAATQLSNGRAHWLF